MEKLIYLLDRKPDLSQEQFGEAVLQKLVPALKREGAYWLTVNLADMDAAMDTPLTLTPRIYGAWDKVAGAIHFWLDSIDTRAVVEQEMLKYAQGISGYLVTESIVQPTQRRWSGTVRRPGVTQFALGQKPAGVSDEHYYYHWQVVHSPWSFELHPRRISYVRNAVARVLTPGAAPWRFIVLEHFALEDFTDESRYYADQSALEQLWKEVPEFLDLDSYVGGPMSEYHFD